jgi:hypothetical protein
MREEVVGGWRRLHNEELHNLHASSHIIRVMESRRMGWACSMMGEMRNEYKIFIRKPGHAEDLGIDGKITVEWILGK